MTLPVEPSVYTGTAGAIKTTKLLTSTAEDYMPAFREVVFTKTPFIKALALKAFGPGALREGKFGNVDKTSGSGIKLTDPSFQFASNLYTSAPTGSHVGRMGTINPQYIDDANGMQYAYKRLVWSIYIPEEFVKDNTGKARLLDEMGNQMKKAQMAAVRDLNYILLGNSSAPASSPYGLPYMISVTQDTSVGNIDPTSLTYWQNKYTACTSVGGGGDLDRPLALLRKMEKAVLDVDQYTGSTETKALVGTLGAYMYYLRAAYADTVALGTNANLGNKDFYDAGITHAIFRGLPFIYDPAVTTPYGASATTTECIYICDFSELGLAVRKDEYFMVEGWQAPITKDKQRFYQANIWLRYTPYVLNRRIQSLVYNMPNNTDAD